MNRLKRIVHRRRSSNADASVVTLAVNKEDLSTFSPDALAPQKSGVLLKYTNLLKRWKPRYFTLENGVLTYSTPIDEHEQQSSDAPDTPVSPRRRRPKRRLLRRIASRDQKERDIKGSINLQFAVISADESDDCRFAIDVGHELYHIRAESPQDKSAWVDALNTSNLYFKKLISRALLRAKDAPTSKAPDTHAAGDDNRLTAQSSGAASANKSTSDDSDGSFLEDDGLREAEQSRKALISELRRILDKWRTQWSTSSHSVSDKHLLHTLAETFNDAAATDKKAHDRSTLPVARGLIDLTAWCLNVLQTNDEMFDRRLKADLTRMMGGGVPVFPRSQLDAACADPMDQDSSDDEWFDALSRAASFRSTISRATTRTVRMEDLAHVFKEPAAGSSQDRIDGKVENGLDLLVKAEGVREEPKGPIEEELKQQQQQDTSLKRVSTSIIAKSYKRSRTSLPPLPGPKEKLNVFALLKDSIGKDLSKISMPVTLNEPLTFIQRLAEDIEYSELLDVGAGEKDPNRRMMYAAAMVISHYSSTQGRVSKPFNPLLGETACVIRPGKGKGVRYIAEQVSHHPPISACYAEGSKNSWKYYNSLEVKNKFWGKSLEVFPTGLNHIEFPEFGDHYVFEQVTSCVHNIVIGRMWLDNYGNMEIVNRTNGGRCTINFSKSGWMSDAKSFGAIKGTIYDKSGKTAIRIGGNWTRGVYEILPNGKKKTIWTVEERPSLSASQDFNMTKWSITLNPEVTDEERPYVPPTDSRFRPDQRALERGNTDAGNKIKSALEEGQRARRRQMEEEDKQWEPKWFNKSLDKETGQVQYLYGGDFFEMQAKQDWSRCPDIFSCGMTVANGYS